MICLEDLIMLEEQNKKTIEENNAIVCEKQAQNVELEAENRVFAKLISIEKAKQEPTEENI